MRRILIYSRTGTPLGEINPNDVLSAVLREEINGEHSLEITTTQVLDKGVRLLHQDGRGKWREFTLMGLMPTIRQASPLLGLTIARGASKRICRALLCQ